MCKQAGWMALSPLARRGIYIDCGQRLIIVLMLQAGNHPGRGSPARQMDLWLRGTSGRPKALAAHGITLQV